ncbi:hypothetical protein V7200_03630 [Cytobacillus firmus]|uniref:Phage protein n=1 Tax=Cytobacillus firmus TaxID=1399 RepID=A0A800N9D9_CYTFI|nr:AP2 domain-containing protein [Cytobacillus firmus]KAF0822653.1 Phage protein [Cytobacillus firmus]
MEQVVENVLVNEAVVLTTKEKRQHCKDQALSRVGQMGINKLGSLMIVDEYNNSQDIWVRFKDGNMVNCTWGQFISGNVKNPYDRSVYGVGYVGEGEYKPSVNGKPTEMYKVWAAMLQRCYSHKFKEKHPTYKDCTVIDEWSNFQSFAKWYDENFYEIEGQRIHLDKDILIKGNKLYSPDTCVFVPQSINSLFVKRDKLRGNLPIGVKTCSRYANKYEVRCCNNEGKRIYIGRFDTPEDGFQAYKAYKEQLIKDIAEEYKECIPHTLYSAMITYTVEVTD